MKSQFTGWYFKQRSGENVVAFIPAVHTDRHKKRTGSLQIVLPGRSFYLELPGSVSICRGLPVFIAPGCAFSPAGLELNIERADISISGRLSYADPARPRGDIMGPFRFVPLMECRHSVFSLTHAVDGRLVINGSVFDFLGGTGYIEGDRGRSFPDRYVWTHCDWFDSGPCSLMLSAATVRPLGREFTGIIGAVFYKGREYRLATYKGAKLLEVGGGSVSVRQGGCTLTARLEKEGGQVLRAPVSGAMTRLIKENIACRARYIFTENERVLFDFTSNTASFEYEY